MSQDPAELLWPVDRLPDALEQIAQRAGYGGKPGELSSHDPTVEPSRIWMFALAGRLGVELEPVTPLYRELPDVVDRAAPAVLQVRRDGRPFYLVVLGKRFGKVRLLARDSSVASVDAARVIALVRQEKQASLAVEVDQLLAGVGDHRARARQGARQAAAAAARSVGAADVLDHAAAAHRQAAHPARRHARADRRHPRQPPDAVARARELVLDPRARRLASAPRDRVVPGLDRGDRLRGAAPPARGVVAGPVLDPRRDPAQTAVARRHLEADPRRDPARRHRPALRPRRRVRGRRAAVARRRAARGAVARRSRARRGHHVARRGRLAARRGPRDLDGRRVRAGVAALQGAARVVAVAGPHHARPARAHARPPDAARAVAARALARRRGPSAQRVQRDFEDDGPPHDAPVGVAARRLARDRPAHAAARVLARHGRCRHARDLRRRHPARAARVRRDRGVLPADLARGSVVRADPRPAKGRGAARARVPGAARDGGRRADRRPGRHADRGARPDVPPRVTHQAGARELARCRSRAGTASCSRARRAAASRP